MNIDQPIHIVISDDHELLRKGIYYTVMSFENCTVDFEAEDGLDLLEKIDAADKKPDICLLDISMPRMDGYQALLEIKKRWPSIKVIIISTFYKEYTIIKTLRDGASCCLPKEVSNEELKMAIHQVMKKGRYYNELTEAHLSNSLYSDAKNFRLSELEHQFLKLCCSDLTYKEIAEKLQVSHRTVDGYRDSLFNKLNLTSRTGLVMFAMQTGIFPI